MKYSLLLLTSLTLVLSGCKIGISQIDAEPSGSSGISIFEDLKTIVNRDTIQAKCVTCHVESGIASATRLSFVTGVDTDAIDINYIVLTSGVASNLILSKATGGNSHAGGVVISRSSAQYSDLEDLLSGNFASSDTGSSDTESSGNGSNIEVSRELAEQINLETPDKTFRRAAVILGRHVPAQSDINALKSASNAELKTAINGLLNGEGFNQFLIDGFNDRTHVMDVARQGHISSTEFARSHRSYYPRLVEVDRNDLKKEVAQEPFRLLINIVEKNRPYTEIITADYTMVSQNMAIVFNTGLTVAVDEWVEAKNNGQVTINSEEVPADVTAADGTPFAMPHAGVLSTFAYLNRIPTTPSNRNRARARHTMDYFLGFDIQNSASRDFSEAALLDTDNPTLNNAECTVCHSTMDPVAASFQNYNALGTYRSEPLGMDSLPYKEYKKDSEYYHYGDSWFGDVLPAGFAGKRAPNDNASLPWLAKEIAKDDRFYFAAIRFWWPAIFGEELLEDTDPAIDPLAHQRYITQSDTVNAMAESFKQHKNLKTLLTDMVLSPYFRAAEIKSSVNADDAIIYGGGRRLLTPAELNAKTESVMGTGWLGRSRYSYLLDDGYSVLYGGQDDGNTVDRARQLSATMFLLAKRNAAATSCSIIYHHFSSKGTAVDVLFNIVEPSDTDESLIRQQLQVLFTRMHNRDLAVNDIEITEAYKLFIAVRENKIARNSGDALLEANDANCADYGMSGVPRDPESTLTAWRAVITAMMMDIDFIYE